MDENFLPLTITAYAERAALTDQHSDGDSLAFPLLGLFGETGSLLSEVKKKQRDRASYLGYAAAVVEELGDVLWYLATVAARGGIALEDVFAEATPAAYEHARGKGEALSLAAVQPEFLERFAEPTAAFEKTLLKLAGDVGHLMSEQEAGRLANLPSALVGRLAAIARDLIQASNEAGVTLEAAAVKNLAKTADRWPRIRTYPDLLDADADEEERLPRTLTVEIFERSVQGKTYVFQRCNGVNIGDRLTDNALPADDYRFHDVFHYAYVAVLGWSPVTRSLLRIKRKSDPAIDDVQDGARATLIEEGIATWIFGQASKLDMFEGVKPGGLPFDLLKHVRQFVAGYEAEQCPLWLWEEAILQGYAAFRFLRHNRRGRLKIDMERRLLAIEPLP